MIYILHSENSYTFQNANTTLNTLKQLLKLLRKSLGQIMTVLRRCFLCGSFMLFLSCFLYAFMHLMCVDALWSPAGKGLTYWLSFVMSYCDVVTFPLVS